MIIKDKGRFTFKLFVIVWVVLLVHVILKLTFNYWQPYVIPNDQLQAISDFIDKHRWIQATLNGIWYIFNGYIMICCSLQVWHLGKNKSIITLILLFLGFLCVAFIEQTIVTILLSIIYPLILNCKKWLTIILTFALTNVFLFLSLWFEGFVNSDHMNYIIGTFLQFDYYIMLILNYFVFNLIRKEK